MPTGTRAAAVSAGAAALAPSGTTTVGVKTEVPVDHKTVLLQSGPSAGGVMRVQLSAVDIGYVMKIERIGVQVTNTANPTTCTIFVGPSAPGNQVDYTPDGNQDQADEFNPILVPGGVPLTIEWDGATDGAIGYARVQYTVAVIVAGQISGG